MLVSKILNTLSLIGIVFVFIMYLFFKWTFVPLALSLIVILLLRLVGQTLKAKYYEKEYLNLKNKTQDIMDSIDRKSVV